MFWSESKWRDYLYNLLRLASEKFEWKSHANKICRVLYPKSFKISAYSATRVLANWQLIGGEKLDRVIWFRFWGSQLFFFFWLSIYVSLGHAIPLNPASRLIISWSRPYKLIIFYSENETEIFGELDDIEKRDCLLRGASSRHERVALNFCGGIVSKENKSNVWPFHQSERSPDDIGLGLLRYKSPVHWPCEERC